MNWSGRNVLITGGAGHIGSHLTAELVKTLRPDQFINQKL
jgi:nucleoside-diphosphate-sugar epimerase